jgi:hypothetical protein
MYIDIHLEHLLCFPLDTAQYTGLVHLRSPVHLFLLLHLCGSFALCFWLDCFDQLILTEVIDLIVIPLLVRLWIRYRFVLLSR